MKPLSLQRSAFIALSLLAAALLDGPFEQPAGHRSFTVLK